MSCATGAPPMQQPALGVLALLGLAWSAHRITSLAEDRLPGPHRGRGSLAVPAHRGHAGRAGHRLFLNGNLQLPSATSTATTRPGAPGRWRRTDARGAVLGGGDGMAVREIPKYPSVESVTLVELDPP